MVVRPSPSQVAAAAHGTRPFDLQPAGPPPLPQPSFAPAAPEFTTPVPYPLPPPAAPAYPQQAPAYYPPQAFPQGQPHAGYGYPQQAPPTVIVHNTIVNGPTRPYVVRPQKSAVLAALLAFLFGPLGMVYSTVLGALVMFAVNLILMVPTFGLIFLITWPVGIMWAVIAANSNTN